MNAVARLSVWLLLSVLALGSAVLSCEGDDDDSDEPADDDADDDSADDDSADDDDSGDGMRRIAFATVEDRVRGSWVGQMAGVAWGASTEFHYSGRTIPDDEVPAWEPSMVNDGYYQDDLYVELPFLEAMRVYGATAGWDVFGPMFRDTVFPLAHANRSARQNLNHGIPAPDSGHFSNNEHADDIDWQIEADFVGAMCPGLFDPAIDIAWRAGHVMNFGDGVLGGVFVSAMHAAAFFADDLDEIVEAGRQALPAGSKYRLVVEDVIAWHAEGRAWEETWRLLEDKWAAGDRCPDMDASEDIDAKLNGAYVLIGLLYGGGDMEASMRIAMRCGQDSDCNPSTVGSILGAWLGLSGIPDVYKAELNTGSRFLFTDYTFDHAVEVNLDLGRQVVALAGGWTEQTAEGEVWVLPPETEVRPAILEQWPESANDPPALSAYIASQEGRTVELQASAVDADGILAFEWSFGDLGRAAGDRVTREYLVGGTYEVIVHAADGVGNTSWQSFPVTVP